MTFAAGRAAEGNEPQGRRGSRVDLILTALVLAAATGFRFLGVGHFQGGPDAEGAAAGPSGFADLMVALEVVLIPLALAAMVARSRDRPGHAVGWRPTVGGIRGLSALLALAALLIRLRGMPASAVIVAIGDIGQAGALPASMSAVVGLLLIVAEEVLRRGFLLNELSTALGGMATGTAGALLILAAAEAVSHAPAGAPAAVAAAGADLALGAAYVLAGRSIWPPVLLRAVTL